MTMKASELRIGNYVSDRHASDSFFAVVKKLDYSRCYYGSFHSAYSDLKPIPLTEEWLLRFGLSLVEGRTGKKYLFLNGFWHLVNDLYYQNGAVYIAEYWGENMHPITQTSIQYVHQLQNLYFALTGEELELKNP